MATSTTEIMKLTGDAKDTVQGDVADALKTFLDALADASKLVDEAASESPFPSLEPLFETEKSMREKIEEQAAELAKAVGGLAVDGIQPIHDEAKVLHG